MLTEILTAYVDATQKIFKQDRSETVGASEIGKCERQTRYFKNAELQDRDHIQRWGATRRGDLIEQHLVVPALRKRFGKKYLWGGKQQRNFRKGHLSATPDGLVIGLKSDALRYLGVKYLHSDCILIEIKSLDPRANREKEKHMHRMQVIVQLGLIRMLTKYKPDFALIVYVDASFHDDVTEFVIGYDDRVFRVAQERATRILTAENASDLMPEGYIAGGYECEHCPFKDACGIERHVLPSNKYKPADIDPQRVAEMTDLCRNAQVLEVEAENLQTQLKECREIIRNRLREWEISKIPGVVSLTSVKGRVSYNQEALREAATAAGVDVEQFVRMGEPTSRLTISLPELAQPEVAHITPAV